MAIEVSKINRKLQAPLNIGIHFSTLLLSIFTPIFGTGHVEITGVVSNCCGEPVAGAIISLRCVNSVDTSGPDGKFSLIGTGIRFNEISNKKNPVKFESLDLFDIQGRRLHAVTSGNTSSLATCSHVALPSSVCIAKYSNKHGSVLVKKALWVRNGLHNAEQSAQTSPLAKKTTMLADSLHIVGRNYAKKSVALNSYIQNVGTISLVRQGDEFGDCEKTLFWSDSAARLGINAMADSLIKSKAAFAWSANGFKIFMAGSSAYCLNDVSRGVCFPKAKVMEIRGIIPLILQGISGCLP